MMQNEVIGDRRNLDFSGRDVNLRQISRRFRIRSDGAEVAV